MDFSTYYVYFGSSYRLRLALLRLALKSSYIFTIFLLFDFIRLLFMYFELFILLWVVKLLKVLVVIRACSYNELVILFRSLFLPFI